MEKSISPLFPSPRGDVVASDWCISIKSFRDTNLSKGMIGIIGQYKDLLHAELVAVRLRTDTLIADHH